MIAVVLLMVSALVAAAIPPNRPPVSQRKFVSPIVEQTIDEMMNKMKDKDLAQLFANAFPNTLDTTVSYYNFSSGGTNPDSFIITGDINAQWLRDSANQLLPYVPLLATKQHSTTMHKHDEEGGNEDGVKVTDAALASLVCGLIHRHANDILHDSFANSFNKDDDRAGHQDDNRKPAMTPHVFEGKYEVDSLAFALRLATTYYEVTQDSSCFLSPSSPFTSTWLSSVQRIVDTYVSMQQPANITPVAAQSSPYLFQRQTSQASDTLYLSGVGPPASYTGMTRQLFRPSDDAVLLPFNIPGNALAAVELARVATLLDTHLIPQLQRRQRDNSSCSSSPSSSSSSTSSSFSVCESSVSSLSESARQLASEITTGIWSFGVSDDGKSLLYEVDGFGNGVFMDDANLPSLLSLPFFGFINGTDPIYQATRSKIWSRRNPYFFNGSVGAGVGGPHVGLGFIWPMSVIMFCLTSDSDDEIVNALALLKASAMTPKSSSGEGLLHESFWQNDVTLFTRPWFAWVNALFGQLILYLRDTRPHLIF